MSPKQTFYVAGVDGCKAGWLVVIASSVKKTRGNDICGVLKLEKLAVARNFAEVLSETNDCKLVCMDIPIGLSDRKPRQCDVATRKVLGRPRASSIFPAPIRPCLSAKDYMTASRIVFAHCGKKLNKQSFFILDKIRQVDDLMTPTLQRRVREIHPEISFWALNNKKPMRHKKRRISGRKERMKLLSAIFSNMEELAAEVGKLPQVAPDDVLDALAAAWTASQVVAGKARTLPDNPELDRKGLRMEILCPG